MQRIVQRGDASFSAPIKRTKRSRWIGKKHTLLLLITLVFIIHRVGTNTSKFTPTTSSISSTTSIPYRPSFPQEFPPCPKQPSHHMYEFRGDGTVKWYRPTFNLFVLHRPFSMHCLLARAAKRLQLEPFNITICLGDKHEELPFAFGPAMTVDHMKGGGDPFPPPLLFPDATFESWPEVKDYKSHDSMLAVTDAAKKYGLPGTKEWREQRDPRLAWRGSPLGKARLELVNMSSSSSTSSPLFDVVAIQQTDKFELSNTSKTLSRPDFCQYRFLLHTNGILPHIYSSSLKWKFLCGSLVFVPTTPLFVEWWNFGAWQPHQHYVPYDSLEDLLKQVEYYNAHLDEAAVIAQRGMELGRRAFDKLNDFVDDTLQRYAAATRHLEPPPNCDHLFYTTNTDPVAGEKTTSKWDFKSLEDLQEEYGPTVCSKACYREELWPTTHKLPLARDGQIKLMRTHREDSNTADHWTPTGWENTFSSMLIGAFMKELRDGASVPIRASLYRVALGLTPLESTW